MALDFTQNFELLWVYYFTQVFESKYLNLDKVCLSETYSPPGSDAAQRNLPSYEEVIQMSGNFTDAPLNRTRRKGTVNINMQQLEQSRTTATGLNIGSPKFHVFLP